MAGVTDTVGREPQYDAAAENYREHAADALWNAHLDRPACLELLGDVSGNTYSTRPAAPATTRPS